MKFTILSLVLAAPFFATAQPFAAPCPVPDSVLALYRDAADRLALARTFRNGSTWTDSVAIDPAWSETAMNALVAVYNSNLPARDTVLDMLDIHVFPTMPLRSFLVSANADLPWMQQLSQGNIPTGTPAIDQLLSDHGLSLTNYLVFPWGDAVVFSTQANVNILALCALFAVQPGVAYAEPNSVCCDGNTITDSVYTDHIQLVYSKGWCDCMAGCGCRRYWAFNVFPDCSVEYVGSYGSGLPVATSVSSVYVPIVRVFPNPATDFIQLDGLAPGRLVMVHASDGRLVGSDAVQPDHRIDVHALPAGSYWLRTEGYPLFAPVPFVKE